MSEIKIPTRNEIPQNDKWDLSQLFKSDTEWEAELEKIQPLSLEIEAFKGKLGESAENLLAAITKLSEMSQISELVGHYAFLLSAGDAGESAFQEKKSRYIMVASAADARLSFLTPTLPGKRRPLPSIPSASCSCPSSRGANVSTPRRASRRSVNTVWRRSLPSGRRSAALKIPTATTWICRRSCGILRETC